jgi:hypothetical protein
MLYKTMVLGLLEQNPELHRQLRVRRTLLPTLNRLAAELRDRHADLSEVFARTRPGCGPAQAAAEALEVALRELEGRLPPASPSDAEPT